MGDDGKFAVQWWATGSSGAKILREEFFCDEKVARERAETVARSGIEARLFIFMGCCHPCTGIKWSPQ